jgi:hypothetical protein
MSEPTGVRFEGGTGGLNRVRVGLVAGALLALVAAGAVTIGASPTPSDNPGASPSPKQDQGGHRWLGGAPFLRADRLGRLGGGRGIAFGDITISAIDGANVSLKTEDGWTRTIAVTDSTTITKAGQRIARSDLKVGDSVRFRQTRANDGTFTVTELVVVLPRVAGEVTAKTADTITVRRRDGTTETIRVSSATTYRVANVANGGSLADVAVGMFVIAEGTQNADGSLQAARVAAGQRRDIRLPGGRNKDRAPQASPSPSGGNSG